MSKQGGYVAGDWNACCDICGFAFKFSQLKKCWDGSWRDEKCWEPRHPQDFVRGVLDNMSVPVSRPQNIIYLTNSDNIYSPYTLDGEVLG